jgi:hypothetical protein
MDLLRIGQVASRCVRASPHGGGLGAGGVRERVAAGQLTLTVIGHDVIECHDVILARGVKGHDSLDRRVDAGVGD